MFGIGLPELIVLFVLALLIFGPKKLPELGQTLGHWISELRKTSQQLSDDIQKDVKWDIPEKELSPPEPDEKKEDPDHGKG